MSEPGIEIKREGIKAEGLEAAVRALTEAFGELAELAEKFAEEMKNMAVRPEEYETSDRQQSPYKKHTKERVPERKQYFQTAGLRIKRWQESIT